MAVVAESTPPQSSTGKDSVVLSTEDSKAWATDVAPHTAPITGLQEMNAAAPAVTSTVDAAKPNTATNGLTKSTAQDDARAADEAEAGLCRIDSDRPADFEGDIPVSNDPPTAAELEQCADLLLLDSKGQSRPFKSLYSGEGVATRQLIIFVRHFFCGNCQEFLQTLSASITPEELLSLPTPTFITIIGCGRPELMEMYVRETNCQFPLYADPSRKLYEILGMTRTWDMGKKKPAYIQTTIMRVIVSSIFQGLKTGNNMLKGGDFKQVGGEFLFEDGKVVWAHRMRNTRDHSEISDLRKLLGLGQAETTQRKRRGSGTASPGKRSSTWSKESVKNGSIAEEKGIKSAV